MPTRMCLACGKKHLEATETSCPRCGQVTDAFVSGHAPEDQAVHPSSIVARLAALLPGALRPSAR
jgi:uncharacterized paraquat-inducible protein A